MRFTVDDSLAMPLDRYFEILTSDEFIAWSAPRFHVTSRAVVTSEERGDTLVRSIRSEWDLLPFLHPMIGEDHLIVEEQLEIRRRERSFAWTYVPSVYPGRVLIAGITRLEPDGPTRVRQHVDGEVSVRVPALGRSMAWSLVAWMQRNIRWVARLFEEYDGAVGGRNETGEPAAVP